MIEPTQAQIDAAIEASFEWDVLEDPFLEIVVCMLRAALNVAPAVPQAVDGTGWAEAAFDDGRGRSFEEYKAYENKIFGKREPTAVTYAYDVDAKTVTQHIDGVQQHV